MTLSRVYLMTSVFWLFPRVAFGFGLSDHSQMTWLAVAEYNRCARRPVSDEAVTYLVLQNLDEDVNLIKKWGKYSHYFNPEKPLHDLRRLDASLRVVELLGGHATEEVGHAIHHLQDMASPPHVVPVRHSLFDGFETLAVEPTEMPELAASDCADLATWAASFRGDLLTLLDDTALETLHRVRTPWARQFWIENSGPLFGEYGTLGNSFGSNNAYARPVYVAFKAQQLRLAIEATKKALIWAYGL